MNKIEMLEDRCLLSVSLESGVLAIIGTPGNDTVRITQVLSPDESNVIIDFDGTSQAFPSSAVTSIAAQLGEGDDTFDMSGLAIPAVVSGNQGRDSIVGGTADDQLCGGWGGDTIIGGQGNDTLFGSVGRDSLVGNKGADQLRGSRGHDAIDGSNGRDTIVGGQGDDQITAGPGADDLHGGDGNDEFYTEDQGTADTIRAGAGQDVAHGDLIAGQTDLSDAEWYALVAADGGALPTAPDLGSSREVVWLSVLNMGVGQQYADQAIFQFHGDSQIASHTTAVIEWGNGDVTNAQIGPRGRFGEEGYISVLGTDHKYSQPGTYPVTVTVTTEGQSFVVTTSAVVDVVPSVRRGEWSYVLAGQPSDVIAGVFNRVPGDQPSDYTAMINWGDGTVSAGTVEVNAEPVHLMVEGDRQPGELLIVRGAHSFQNRGEGARVLLTSSTRKAVSANCWFEIVDPYTPEPQPRQASTPANSTLPMTLAVIQDKPGLWQDAFKATVDWGDGQSSTANVYFNSAEKDFVIQGSHPYTVAGDYTPTITVKYVDQSVTYTTSVHVIGELPLVSHTGDWIYPDVVEGDLWTQTLATFAPIHPDDQPSDYSASVVVSNADLPFEASIPYTLVRNDQGLFELRVSQSTAGWAGGRNGTCRVDVTISGFDRQARFGSHFSVTRRISA